MDTVSLLTLEIENMFSYSKASVDFSKFRNGIILIEGINYENPQDSNGSGKSSLIDAINWILFDNTVKGESKDSIIKLGAKGCYGRLVFSVGNDIIDIEKGRGKKNFLNIRVNDREIQKKTVTEAIRWINELFELDFNVWKNSILLGQGESNIFLHGTDKHRKELVGNILGFDIYDKCWVYLKQNVLNEITQKKTELESKINLLKEQASSLNMTEIGSRITYLNSEVSQLRRKLSNLRKQEEYIKEQSIKLQEKRKLESELEEVQEELDKVRRLSRNREMDLLKTIEEKKQQLREYDLSKDLKTLKKEVKETEEYIKIIERSIRDRNKQIASLETMKNTIEVEISKIKKKINSFYESKDKTVCPYCGQEVTKECIVKFHQTVKEKKSEISELDAKIIKINKSVNKYEKEKEALLEKLSSLNATIYDLQIATKVQSELSLLEKQLEIERTHAKENISYFNTKIDSLKTKINELNKHMVEDKSLSELSTKILNIESAIEKAIAELEANKSLMNQAISIRKQIGELQKKYNIALEEYTVNSYLERLFGRNGIRLYFLRQIIPHIESIINDYLGMMDIATYNVSMYLDDDKFMVDILDNGVARPVSTYSGGEKKLLTILFNLALAEIVARRKVGFDFMILDEVTDMLDGIHSELIVDLLSKIASQRQKKIYVITHRDDVRDLLESMSAQKIVITKTKEGSTIKNVTV